MAQIVTITNPLTGQPAQVDQLDHTAQEIDDAIDRAKAGGAIDTLLDGKEPAFTTLPISKGGTGANNIGTARANLGIDKLVSCPAGGSISLTLPSNGIYLIGTSDNIRQNGLILVHTSSSKAQNNVLRVTQLASPNYWAYSLSGGVLALSETDGRYAAVFSVVTLCNQDGVVYV